jgi:hypothetical protein
MREQPVAALDHLPGDQCEAWFVGGPGITQAEPRAEHEQGEDPEQRVVAEPTGAE